MVFFTCLPFVFELNKTFVLILLGVLGDALHLCYYNVPLSHYVFLVCAALVADGSTVDCPETDHNGICRLNCNVPEFSYASGEFQRTCNNGAWNGAPLECTRGTTLHPFTEKTLDVDVEMFLSYRYLLLSTILFPELYMSAN